MTVNNRANDATITKKMVHGELQELLRESGTTSKLQTIVRAEILQSVLRDGCDGEAVPSPGSDRHAVVSLAYHELSRLGLAHSTNILLSEFRLRPLRFEEALEVLGFNGGKKCDGAWQPMDLSEVIRTSARRPDVECQSVQVDDIEARSIEERIRAVQHECELRMQQELRERLFVSAKKQAMEASRRVEVRHARQLRDLQMTIESERRRMENLQSEAELRCLSTKKQMSELEQRLIAVGLEKQAIQGEVDLMNDRLKRLQAERFAELTDVRNEMLKEHNTKLAELEDERRALMLERESIKAIEAKFASIEAEKATLIGELSKMRERESASFSLRTELLRLNHDLAERNNHVHSLEKQLVQMKNSLAKSQSRLESSRNEVSGLRNLLKQSKDCLSGLSFRASSALTLQDFPRRHPSTNPAPTYVKSRQNAVLDSAKVTSGVSSFSAADSGGLSKRGSAQPLESRTAVPSARLPLYCRTEACQTSFESDGVDRFQGKTPDLPEDPPCDNLVDPPASETRCHDEEDVLSCGAAALCENSIVGRDVFLNLSAITEEVENKNEGSSGDTLPSIDSGKPCRKPTGSTEDPMPRQAEGDDGAVDQRATGNVDSPNVDSKEATASSSRPARALESSNWEVKRQPDSFCDQGASSAVSDQKISTLTLDKHSSQRTSLDEASPSAKAQSSSSRAIPDTGINEDKTTSNLPAPDTMNETTLSNATSQYSEDFSAFQSRTAAERTTGNNDEIVSFSSQQARIIGGLSLGGDSSSDDYSSSFCSVRN